MSKKEVIEKNVEIANRIPPGDRWQVIGVEGIQNGLTDALEAYYNVATVKPKAFRLGLTEGKLYAIVSNEVEIKEPEPKKYSIYGDYTVE
jgi:hypothetical protein